MQNKHLRDDVSKWAHFKEMSPRKTHQKSGGSRLYSSCELRSTDFVGTSALILYLHNYTTLKLCANIQRYQQEQLILSEFSQQHLKETQTNDHAT